jgi:hypothetical protein
VVITTLAIAGPTWNARLTRDDRLIERGLPQLSEAIRSHTAKSGELPGSLADVRDVSSDDAQALIDRGLVQYTPGDKVEQNAEDTILMNPDRPIVAPDKTSYRYTLCVTYKAKKGNDTYRASYQVEDVSPETYTHDAGRVCYDLQTSYNYSGKYY